MKKILQILTGVLSVTLLYTVPLYATETVEMYMDDHKVATESYNVFNREGKYYMDVLPQVINERTYVPISTITKFLGVSINWQDPHITINYNNTELILTIGENEAIKNGQTIKLDASPYVRNGRTMVPLRFISEELGLGINYQDAKVGITFPKLKINDIQIATIQSEFGMTMGSVISESKTNICISRMYNEFEIKKTKEMEIPSSFGSHNDIDSPDYYYELKEYKFNDSSNNTIAQYKIYSHQSFGNSTGLYAIEDVTNSKWYSCTEENYLNILDLENIGKWVEISNTVV
ncbi:MAG: stalk domain-containing protein [Zhenhengia sp.]|uniref:stalk domain-containing protein n=1 Tax=Zhenhengia sp. TaxID=2944208 RepID=UPI0039922729